jgi:hypothetical protein
MATVTITNSNNRLEDSEATTGWSKTGSASNPVLEPDFVYQGSNSVSSKVKNTAGGIEHDVGAGNTVDMTTGDDTVWMIKLTATNISALNGTLDAYVGEGSGVPTTRFLSIIDPGTRGDIDAPVKGGWLVVPWLPQYLAWQEGFTTVDLIYHTATLYDAIRYFGATTIFSASSKSENFAVDAIDLGTGLWLVGGDSTDPDGTFQDFVDHDEGTSGNRFGHAQTTEGFFILYGKFVVGRNASATVTATVFTEANVVVKFPGGFVDPGWNELEFDLGNASTVVTLDSVFFQGDGLDTRWFYFDTLATGSGGAVSTSLDTIELPDHGLLDLTISPLLQYQTLGGTERPISGLASGGIHGVFVDQVSGTNTTAQEAAFCDARARFYDESTGAIHNLTESTAGNEELQALVIHNIVKPDLTVTSTSGTFDATDCTFDKFRAFTLTSAATFTRCAFLKCESMALSTAELDSCTVTNPAVPISLSFIDTEAGAESEGHCIDITSNSGSPFTFTDNTFIGWGPDAATFSTDSGGINAGTDVITTDAAHGFSTGDAVYYNDEGGVASIGLTVDGVYWVRNITSTTLTLHLSPWGASNDSVTMDLSTSGAETHSLYSANAAILNSSGAAITINVSGGTAPTIRNTDGSTTSVVSGAVTVQVLATTSDGTPVASASVFLRASDDTGPFPFEESVTIVNSTTTATVTHSAHGLASSDKVEINGASHWQNNGPFSITVTDANTYTYTMPSDPGSSPTGTITSTFVALEGATDGSGILSTTKVYATDQPVTGSIRKASASPFYKTAPLNGTVDSADGFTGLGVMILDE